MGLASFQRMRREQENKLMNEDITRQVDTQEPEPEQSHMSKSQVVARLRELGVEASTKAPIDQLVTALKEAESKQVQ